MTCQCSTTQPAAPAGATAMTPLITLPRAFRFNRESQPSLGKKLRISVTENDTLIKGTS